MNAYFEKLETAARMNNSRLCVGLDPRPEKIPAPFRNDADPIFAFNKAIIDAAAPYVCAFKPNFAFYEALGVSGLESLKKSIAYIPKEIPIIADAKRGDIGSTAEAYAKGIFEAFGCDAATLSPFLGGDSVAPFLKYAERGMYILCLTSNSGSCDFQMPHDLYLRIAEKVLEWNTAGNCGLVVGATHPDYLKKIRFVAADLPLLIPGIGAQGGDLEAVIPLAADSKGRGYIINVSRGITEAKGDGNFAANIANASSTMRSAINQARGK
ncbi:MAG TPA: orotidine-5'-phosphate decarboxylase [Candidatus Sumerlaeota bacterium]|nr:MAG: orotidine 5'-phosphate decarboxylase [candidate division BRC1 bacterium ADurb.Bin183]HOE63902.1 orotidine-5'-phosphate decarboxylase [Candidatus Sumerlaeota bacterium]HRR31650.1 orotidine-5'-phosphate decarboxylase [Candidatus Sumerlaeia bacterium]HON51188.1 orotidine-5'-phosphate decarboxylase [Candidatus Sumerlaeota bacterium]HOR64495.1 orotidine-5'-phosphate decarboxylase [Candidatus Sumerlaeota bacterium]